MKNTFLLLTLLLSLLFSNSIFAQPVGNDWIRFYDNDSSSDWLFDIFRGQDLLAMTGYVGRQGLWLLVTDHDGEVQINLRYPDGQTSQNTWGFDVIQTDDEGFLIGNRLRMEQTRFAVLKVDRDGETEWWNDFGDGYGECHTVIERKSGVFVAGGRSNHQAYLVTLSDEGELIWENSFGSGLIHGIREVEDGLLVIVGLGDMRLIFVDNDGELVWEENFGRGTLFDIISLPNGGYVCAGVYSDGPGFYLTKIDLEGNQIWARRHEWEDMGGWSFWGGGVTHLPDDGFVIAGHTTLHQQPARPIIMRTDFVGNEIWRRDDLDQFRFDGLMQRYYGTVTHPDGSALVVGAVENPLERSGYDGVLVKVVLDSSIPEILSWEPEELDIFVLLNDTVTFSVSAIDPQGDSLLYYWTFDNEEVSQDSFAVIDFPELGEFMIECIVSDGAATASISWFVTVVELFISSYSPDNLQITIRRGTTVDFEIESQSIGDDPVNTEWTLQELPNGREGVISEETAFSYQFNFARDYYVTAYAWVGEAIDSRQWQISVKSVIYDYWPEETDVQIDTGRHVSFGVEPFDPSSEMLTLAWYLDDELISSETELDLLFIEPGNHNLSLLARDGDEADTLSWQITVNLPSTLPDNANNIGQFALHPAHPNPFNNQTTLSFDLPQQDLVTINIYDTQSRLIKNLLKEYYPAGSHAFQWHASDFPAGVYLIHLQTGGGNSSMTKVVLIP